MTFNDVLEIKNGRNQKAVENPDGRYPIYGSGGIIGHSDDYICEAGTVIVGRKGSINNPIFVGEPFWNVDTAFGLTAKKDVLLPRYLYYFCMHFDFERLNKAVTIPSLTKSDLLKIEILLPDLNEQQNVVDKLQEVERIMLLHQEAITKLDEIIKARFAELFGDCRLNPKGWNTVALGDIADVGSSKRVFVEELKKTGIPFYRGTEVGALAEGKTVTPELFITEEHYDELIKTTGKPETGDLLMPSICPDGRIWVVDTDEPFYFKDGRVLWVHGIDKRFNPVFLLYTLKDRIMTDYGSIASGTTFAELKIFALKQCQIFDVPIEEQRSFAAFIAQVDKSKSVVQKSLDKMQLLFDSLMQQYFG